MFIAKNEDVIVLANEREDILKEMLDRSFIAYTAIEETDVNYILHNGQYVTQEEIDYQEKVRIANLKLTKREVFLGLYQAKQVTPEMIKAQITDPQALIEFEYANDYYRGNPLIDVIGAQLGFTTGQLDKFFET